AVLAGSGVVFQGVLLNPLAEPYTLGVATGAAFGASLAITLHLPFISPFAFGGGVGALGLVWILGHGGRESSSSTRLILAGVIVGSVLGAGITLIKALAGDQVGVIVLWLLGSFSLASWGDVGWSMASALLVLLLGLFWARDMDVISSGANPRSLGVDDRKAVGLLLFGCSLATAIAVSISGIIGFVGLVVPHLVRLVSGPSHGRLVPLSVLGGALLLLLSDTAARSFGELPVGVITALIGGPIFCFLLWRGR
ncbi:MAG: iron ABC transporter permease, partial [Thermovirgaceae bacterium]|nr:iron ABC transporter permease [Thermovirgaceae bacterium]